MPTTTVLERDDLRRKLDIVCNSDPSTTWELREHSFNTEAVVTQRNGDGTSTFLFQPLLEGMVSRLRNGQWDTSLGEMPLPDRPSIGEVIIADEWVGHWLDKATGVKSGGDNGITPRGGKKQKHWFREVRDHSN